MCWVKKPRIKSQWKDPISNGSLSCLSSCIYWNQYSLSWSFLATITYKPVAERLSCTKGLNESKAKTKFLKSPHPQKKRKMNVPLDVIRASGSSHLGQRYHWVFQLQEATFSLGLKPVWAVSLTTERLDSPREMSGAGTWPGAESSFVQYRKTEITIWGTVAQ